MRSEVVQVLPGQQINNKMITIKEAYQQLETNHMHSLAIVLIMLSCIFHTCGHIIFQLGSISSFSALAIRSSMSIIFINLFDTKHDVYNQEKFQDTFLSQAFLMMRALLIFMSLTYISVGEMTLIYQTNALWSQFLFCLYHKDPITLSRVRNTLLCFFGLYLILNPSFESQDAWLHLLGCTYSLIGSLVQSIAYLYVKKLGTSTSPTILVCYFHIITGAACSILWMYSYEVPSPLPANLYFIPFLLAFFSIAAQLCQFRATSLVAYSKIANYTYITPLFAMVMDILVFGILPSLKSLLGGAIIIVSIAVQLREDKAGAKG